MSLEQGNMSPPLGSLDYLAEAAKDWPGTAAPLAAEKHALDAA
jgi:hypothetical protein